MAYNQYGISTVNFGTPLLTAFGVISQGATVDQTPNINATVENETGSIVVQRLDDTTTSFNFNGTVNNGTSSFSLYVGAAASLTSSVFTGPVVCEKLGVTYANKEFTKFTATLTNHEYLNYSVVT